MKSKLLEGLVALIVVVIFAGLTSTSVLDSLELKVHDAFTRLVPPPPENKHITIVNVDDLAIQNVGQWPWSRDILAKILVQLKELGASYLTFDIEFVDRGPVGVTSHERDQTLASKTDELSQVFDAMKSGIMKPDEAGDAAKTILSESVLMTARDNDAYLGKAAKLFGNTFTTINYDLPADKNNAEAQDAYKYLWSNSALPEVSGNIDSLPLEKDIRGAITAVASEAK